MPLPPTLTSTYRQYKHDTEIVASWLAQTGLLVGCPDELLTSASSGTAGKPKPAGGGRLKGKDRKKAKSAAASPASAPSASSPAPAPAPRYALAIKNFVPLAEAISSSEIGKDKVDIPPEFTAAIGRAISVRQAFANLL